MATWFVQRRIPAALESRGALLRLFTWKRTLLGGVAAFAVLAIVTLVVVVVHKRGTLLAQGVIENDQPIVLADFVSTARDTTLGSVVTEALRVDLMRRAAAMFRLAELYEAAGDVKKGEAVVRGVCARVDSRRRGAAAPGRDRQETAAANE